MQLQARALTPRFVGRATAQRAIRPARGQPGLRATAEVLTAGQATPGLRSAASSRKHHDNSFVSSRAFLLQIQVSNLAAWQIAANSGPSVKDSAHQVPCLLGSFPLRARRWRGAAVQCRSGAVAFSSPLTHPELSMLLWTGSVRETRRHRYLGGTLMACIPIRPE
jgi:hypothetical protein